MIDPKSTTLADLLRPCSQAEVARLVGLGDSRRGTIHRLYHGQPLYDDTLIAPLARVLHVEQIVLEQIVANDRARARRTRSRRQAQDAA